MTRRLPGIRFETKSPPLAETLPRMDVALFVGFAASGPLQTPVAVEDFAQFTLIFGGEVTLAWDEQAGENIKAYLAPAVKAFFGNGGRRCWVVRVAADHAATNHFPIPGLAQFDGVSIRPAFAAAASVGSWSDDLQVSASLSSHALALTPISLPELTFALTLAAPGEVVAGDLLRLTFREAGYLLLCTVKSVEPDTRLASPPLPGAPEVIVVAENALWLEVPAPASPPPTPSQAFYFPHADLGPIVLPTANAPLNVTTTQGVTRISFELVSALEDAPAPGSLLRVDVEGKELWLVVQEIEAATPIDTSPEIEQPEIEQPEIERVEITGEGFYALPAPPLATLDAAPLSDKLSFELAVRRAGGYPQRLSNLAFAPKHPLFWGALPSDEQLYAMTGATSGATSGVTVPSAYGALWQSVATPRFPLAGGFPMAGALPLDEQAQHPVFFPVAMPPLGDLWLAADRPDGDVLERDGLDHFDAMLFLDDAIVGSTVNTLYDQADFVRYQSEQLGQSGRELRGIYAGLGIEEVTLVVVPDAVHRGWQPVPTLPPPPPEPPLPFERPEWWTFLDCAFPPSYERVTAPQRANFLACGLRVIPAPTLSLVITSPVATALTDRGDYWLTWTESNETEVNETGIRYVLEESPFPDYRQATVVYHGLETSIAFSGRGFGDYYYRVRAEIVEKSGVTTSDWSEGVVVRVAPLRRWVAHAEDRYDEVQPGTLLAVQRALLRLCAARGDLFALLALPAHYREDDAIRHIAQLRSPLPTPLEIAAISANSSNSSNLVLPLGYGEARALSYGALYHPWLVERVQERPLIWQNTPPDGAACGILAQRALNRGAWIAPANELLRDVIALTPPVARERRLDLQLAQLNLVRQEPRGFVVLNADTLSNDPDLRPINVRRLLMLLRRLALREGFRYVFEPNDESFRRLVQRSFEAMLEQMFVRGAFAGPTPATSYQVVTSNTLNTRQSVEQGRFIVELRVAPSLPMTFLTIRLVQSHERTFVTE